MVNDLRRTPDSYAAANCASCVRNGLLIIRPDCPVCHGSGKFENEAAATYRAKANQVMLRYQLSEADLTTTHVNGTVYGNRSRTPDEPTVVNPPRV